MGDFVVDDEQEFSSLLSLAGEIVLPGAAGVRVPQPRSGGGWFEVTGDCVVLTEGMPAYGG